MRFTFDWLKRYLETDLSVGQIADKLTFIGLEVETLYNPEKLFEKFKIVQVESVEKHSNADNLNVCSVVDGVGDRSSIVCGAKNVRPGMKAILAMPGAVIPASGTALKKSKIRGIESGGMMCSFDELMISRKSDGIIEIDQTIDLSTSVGDALGFGGGVLDVSVTPNRGDCFSVKGIARDLAASGAGKLVTPSYGKLESPKVENSSDFPMKIIQEKNDASRRYAPIIAFQIISGIKNEKSPEWLKSLFSTIGVNSISSIVDLSNFWMMDSGRPLHIYDLKKIKGNLTIRFAKSKEKFIDINGNEHILEHDMLISADDDGPLCILGVMGGARAACDETTTDILVESGFFDPVSISKTGTFLNLTSDSRVRFERCIDHESCVPGLATFSSFVSSICGGKASSICTIGERLKTEKIVELRKSKMSRVSGAEISWKDVRLCLERIGLREVNADESKASFLIPSWRSDLNIEEDLIEEVLRMIGYENVVEESFDTTVAIIDKKSLDKQREIAVKRLLACNGLSEIVSYSFINQGNADVFGGSKKLIKLLNPISGELSIMRPSLMPNLLAAAKKSLNYGQSGVQLFESGNIFFDDCVQEPNVAGVRAGAAENRSWRKHHRVVDVFDAKRDLMSILEYYGLYEKDITIAHEAPSYYHPSRSGTVFFGRRALGSFGELHPKVNKLLDVSERIVGFEFFTNNIDVKHKKSLYVDKIFPKITRDFSFVFDQKISIGNSIAKIYKLDERIITAEIFDCFSMNDNKKSVGITVSMRETDRTMTEEEAQAISDKIIKHMESIGGMLRSK